MFFNYLKNTFDPVFIIITLGVDVSNKFQMQSHVTMVDTKRYHFYKTGTKTKTQILEGLQ